MTTLIVDSACDLPKSLIDKSNVKILPATIIYDQQSLQDYRDTDQTIKLYETGAFNKGHDSETAPTSSRDIARIIETTLAAGETEIVIQTVNRVRSPTYENAVEAITAVLKNHSNQELNIRVQDSRTVLAGQGVLAAHTVALINKGINGTKLRRVIDSLSSKVHSYQIPKDVYYLRSRGRKKGDKSISLLGAVMGRALHISPIVLAFNDQTFPVEKIRGFNNAADRLFKHAIVKVHEGLVSPFVCISIAGNPKDLNTLPSFQELKLAVQARKYQLIVTPMSLSGGVNLGPGTLSLAFACQPYEWTN